MIYMFRWISFLNKTNTTFHSSVAEWVVCACAFYPSVAKVCPTPDSVRNAMTTQVCDGLRQNGRVPIVMSCTRT